jgi:hypothetical protein
VFCAILYLLRTGCPRRFLPDQFPKWNTLYAYFGKWNQPDEQGPNVLELAKSRVSSAIALDTQVLPHTVAVSTADVTDRQETLQALQRCKPSLKQAQSLLADGGYVGESLVQRRREIFDVRPRHLVHRYFHEGRSCAGMTKSNFLSSCEWGGLHAQECTQINQNRSNHRNKSAPHQGLGSAARCPARRMLCLTAGGLL